MNIKKKNHHLDKKMTRTTPLKRNGWNPKKEMIFSKGISPFLGEIFWEKYICQPMEDQAEE